MDVVVSVVYWLLLLPIFIVGLCLWLGLLSELVVGAFGAVVLLLFAGAVGFFGYSSLMGSLMGFALGPCHFFAFLCFWVLFSELFDPFVVVFGFGIIVTPVMF